MEFGGCLGRALCSVLLPSQEVLVRRSGRAGWHRVAPGTGTGWERRKKVAVVSRGGCGVSWGPGQVPARALAPSPEDAWRLG